MVCDRKLSGIIMEINDLRKKGRKKGANLFLANSLFSMPPSPRPSPTARERENRRLSFGESRHDPFFRIFYFFSQIQSNPLKSSPIFFGVGLALCACLRFNDVDRQNVPLLEPWHDFYFFVSVFRRV